MNDPDGLAFLLWFSCAGLVAIGLAWCGELYQGREMRKRARQRAALERYLGLVNPKEQP